MGVQQVTAHPALIMKFRTLSTPKCRQHIDKNRSSNIIKALTNVLGIAKCEL